MFSRNVCKFCDSAAKALPGFYVRCSCTCNKHVHATHTNTMWGFNFHSCALSWPYLMDSYCYFSNLPLKIWFFCRVNADCTEYFLFAHFFLIKKTKQMKSWVISGAQYIFQHLTDLFHTVFEHIAHQVNSAAYIYQQLFFFLGADGALNVPWHNSYLRYQSQMLMCWRQLHFLCWAKIYLVATALFSIFSKTVC